MVKKISLGVVLVLALFLRVYRVDDLLGFYYDQGRDAKVIWDLWHSGKFFLIGPTTGIEGIFLGPFFYYFIAPFYLLGNGNPVVPAIWLAIVNVLGIYVIYRIGKDYFNESTGILSAFLISISLNLVQAHRWLSNPTPLPLFSAVSVWLLLKIVIKKQAKTRDWLLLGLCLGTSLQLEAASAVFFLPATALILLLNKVWPKAWLFLTFGLTLLPQILFNFRHQNILIKAFQEFLIGQKSFRPVFVDFMRARLIFYFEVFSNKFALDDYFKILFTFCLLILAFIIWKRISKRALSVLMVWWITPLIFLLFYHGNYGYVWEYYFTGVFTIVSLIVGVILGYTFNAGKWGKAVVTGLLILVAWQNTPTLYSYLIAGLDGKTHITLGTSLAAVDWVYRDAGKKSFNVDVYVPPVIPHAYDYLFLWRGKTKWKSMSSDDRQSLLYTLFEVDPPHPERLEAWMARQKGIGIVETQESFGGVTVQKRHRI